jgi:hypothetical protein
MNENKIQIWLCYCLIIIFFAEEIKSQIPMGVGMYANTTTKVTATNGNVAKLKAIKKVSITYDYSMMMIVGYGTEQAFLNKLTEKKDSVKAEKFKEQWYNHRKEEWEPYFLDLFNSYGFNGSIKGENYSTDGDAKLIVDVTKLVFNDTGAFADATCSLLDKDDELIIRITIKDAVGSKFGKEATQVNPCFKIFGKATAKKLVKAKLKLE